MSRASSTRLATEQELVAMLREKLDTVPSGKAGLAATLGIGNCKLTNILRGGRGIDPPVAERLGYRRVIRFEPIDA